MQDALKLPNVLQEAREVMRDACETLSGYSMERDFFETYMAANGSYEARLLGTAALHALAEGDIGESGWPLNIYEYGTNNADMPEWEVSLYAGIGHIAAIATRV